MKRLILAVAGLFLVLSALTPAASANELVIDKSNLPEGTRLVEVTEYSPAAVPPGTYWVLDDEHIYLRNVNSGKCMGVAGSNPGNNAGVVQWTCHPSATSDQRMLVNQVGTSMWHQLNPAHSSGKCIGVNASRTTPGAQLIQWDCVAAETDQHYAFRLINPDSNLSRIDIIVRHSEQAVGVAGGHRGDGGPVVQWTWHGGVNRCAGDQCWDIVYEG